MTDAQSLEEIKKVFQKFYTTEQHILENDLHVRCLTGKLMQYLLSINEEWEVFIDYNYQYQTAYKTNGEFGTVSLFPNPKNDIPLTETKIRLYPQISILKDKTNFIALDLHKSTSRNTPKYMVDKIKTLTSRDSPLHYKYGLCLYLSTGKDYQNQTKIQVHKVNENVVNFDFK
jgi:hypothetical protein